MNELEADAWRALVVRAWADESFKRALIAEPNRVLGEAGLSVKAGVEFVVVEDEPQRVHLVLPAAPRADIFVESLAESGLSDYDPGF